MGIIPDLKNFLPEPQDLEDFPIEEIGPRLLKWIAASEEAWNGKFNPLSLFSGDLVAPYSGREKLQRSQLLLSEAWTWLDHEGMFVPDDWRGWFRFSRRGRQCLAELAKGSVSTLLSGKILPKDSLHPTLRTKVWPIFVRGDFDTAVFAAMKEVEVQVRAIGSFDNNDYGVDLMRAAFHPEKGPLTDAEASKSEREALGHLFAGAIGTFKNPSSHRNVNFDDPHRAAEAIQFANLLLKIVAERQGLNPFPDQKIARSS